MVRPRPVDGKVKCLREGVRHESSRLQPTHSFDEKEEEEKGLPKGRFLVSAVGS